MTSPALEDTSPSTTPTPAPKGEPTPLADRIRTPIRTLLARLERSSGTGYVELVHQHFEHDERSSVFQIVAVRPDRSPNAISIPLRQLREMRDAIDAILEAVERKAAP